MAPPEGEEVREAIESKRCVSSGTLSYERGQQRRKKSPSSALAAELRIIRAGRNHSCNPPDWREGCGICALGCVLSVWPVLGPRRGLSPRNSTSHQDPVGLICLRIISPTGIFNRMSDVTRILSAIEQGDPHAADRLLPLVYDELRRLAAQKLAQEKPGQTLEATALVHEAYLRLVGANSTQPWDSRGHFFAAAAEAMGRILTNRARDKGRYKHGDDWRRLDLDHLAVADEATEEETLAVNEALERLEQHNKPCAELVKLRFFAGLTMGQS